MGARKPNVLLILADQLRHDTLGCTGNPWMRTPALDGLAAGGACLDGFFANSPVCVPSRCSFHTGRYPHAHRCRENHALLEPGREFHLFRVLRSAGYRLGLCGKNHLLEDAELGNLACFDQRGSDSPAEAERPLLEAYRAFREQRGWPPGTRRIWQTGYAHDFPPEATKAWQTATAAIDFLGGAPREEPFALAVNFEDPHVPHLAPRELVERHLADEDPLPSWEGVEGLAAKHPRWLVKHGAFQAEAATDDDRRRYRAVYRAMVDWLDTQVGRILESLERLGLREDTLVIFSSDHGDFCFEHGLPKKDLVLVDSLLHVPCLWSFPGVIPPGLRSPALAESVDVMPTILDLLGMPVPPSVQGSSFEPLLRGASTTHKTAVFAEVCPPWLSNPHRDLASFEAAFPAGKVPFNVAGDAVKSIREERFRYTWYADGFEELHDLATDPGELWNRAADPALDAERVRLKLRLLEWHALTEDPLDPMLARDLDARYPRWSPRSIAPGRVERPWWTRLASSGKPPRTP